MPRQQQAGESDHDYTRAAARYAREQFARLRDTPDYRYCHQSFAVAEALRLTEGRFVDLGTFGEEGDCEGNGEGHIDIQYLNAGDTYALTVIYYRGRFRATTLGNILE